MKTEKLHVLVLDDEAPMRGLLKDFLQSQGYRVSCFSSASVAIKFIREVPSLYAVIADIRMSPMDGIDFLKLVKDAAPALPVFLFTAAGSSEEKKQALKLGASKYLFKPFPLFELKYWLEQLADKKAATELVSKAKR